MIKVIIIEDEPSALRRLKRMVMELRPQWKIVNSADNVKSGIKIVNEQNFDLILSDIQLSDGTCFDIFTNTKVIKPVIFITAYDEYAIKAFEFNSIHYLLKPIKLEQLHLAFQKFEQNLIQNFDSQASLFYPEKEMQKKLLSKVGNKTKVINFSEIAFIIHADRITKAYLFDSTSNFLDQSLDKLEEYLPDEQFFRINRQIIVNRDAIQNFRVVSSSRLKLITDPIISEDAIVSKDKTPYFKRWIENSSN